MDTSRAVVPVDDDIRNAVDAVWDSLAVPGRWLTGTQRVEVAAECRRAAREQRGRGDALGDRHRDLVASVVHDPAGLHDTELDQLCGDDMTVDEYVETVAVAAKVVATDALCDALGMEPLPLPAPVAGEPTQVRPEGAADLGGRVPMLSAEDLTAVIGPGTYHVNVRRGHSLVPEEAGLQVHLVEALYVPDLLAHGLEGRRGLGRDQIEAIATRVSTLNRCFYCSAGHAQLLAMSGDPQEPLDVVAAAQGDDPGVRHSRELLDLAEAMVRGRPTVEEARANAAAVLDPQQLLGAVATTAAFMLLNRVADSAGIPLDEMAVGLLDTLPEQLALG